MAITTGVSTAEEFVDAINEKGASLTNESTPEGLLEAINATGGNVTFQSTNEAIVSAVNTEVGPTGFDIIFRTFSSESYEDRPCLGIVNENVEFPKEFWSDGSSGELKLADDGPVYIILDKDGVNARLTDVSYYPDEGVFMFELTQDVLAVAQKYGSLLVGCPVYIHAPASILTKGDTQSNALDINEIFGGEHLPNWLSEAEYTYTLENKDDVTSTTILEALQGFPATTYDDIHDDIETHHSGHVCTVKIETANVLNASFIDMSKDGSMSGDEGGLTLSLTGSTIDYIITYNTSSGTVIVREAS